MYIDSSLAFIVTQRCPPSARLFSIVSFRAVECVREGLRFLAVSLSISPSRFVFPPSTFFSRLFSPLPPTSTPSSPAFSALCPSLLSRPPCARVQASAQQHSLTFQEPIPVQKLASHVADVKQVRRQPFAPVPQCFVLVFLWAAYSFSGGMSFL